MERAGAHEGIMWLAYHRTIQPSHDYHHTTHSVTMLYAHLVFGRSTAAE